MDSDQRLREGQLLLWVATWALIPSVEVQFLALPADLVFRLTAGNLTFGLVTGALIWRKRPRKR